MKLSEWAKKNGVCYKTAWRWFRDGNLPASVQQLKTGTILIKEQDNAAIPRRTAIYCRVSNHSRKAELDCQVKRCEDFCLTNGWPISKIYKEIASGLNDERKQFWAAIDSKPSRLVVENKDRLTRFGFFHLEKLLKERGCEIVVLHPGQDDESDIIKDMVSVIYSFCARLYGMRRAYNKTVACKQALGIKDDS